MSNSQVRIKQWVTLAILTTVVITFAIIMAIFSQGREKQEKSTPATTINLDNHSFNEEHFVTTYGAKMSELEKEVANLQAQIKREEERKNREAKVKAREERFNDAFDSVEYESVGDITATSDNSNGFRPVSKKTQPIDGPRIVIKKVSDISTVDSTDNHKKDDIAKNRTREKKADDLLITGSFARARLLNGVEAPTGGQANGNPVPMLLEIKDPAFLPNRYRSDIKRCMVTANATGDLSSERVLVRLDRMSCITNSRGAIDVRVTGYVTGEDGKTGLKARVVTRSGQAIANALLVGTLSGLGEAVSLAAQDSTTNFAGTVTNSVNNPWRAGLGDGMKDAMDRVADYYLKLADKIFPVLEVDAGRDVDIVITQSSSIVTEKSIF
ncbi:TraB/VirB10 family protein [Parasutterella secunda]|uniref:TraB/VirB10 family protein n=1 Tax=Parasutterella secunda TaxID=626947 RepID=UPI0025A35F0E|nr:TraB/VirB10 family protein [Parasutterella secunda]MDM8226001.1 TraB/VirB10 family protein [Parasutterella secunda]